MVQYWKLKKTLKNLINECDETKSSLCIRMKGLNKQGRREKMDDKQILELYNERSEAAISETAEKYGKYCHYIAYNILYNIQDKYSLFLFQQEIPVYQS